jgi:hypothetical protein
MPRKCFRAHNLSSYDDDGTRMACIECIAWHVQFTRGCAVTPYIFGGVTSLLGVTAPPRGLKGLPQGVPCTILGTILTPKYCKY